VDFNTISIVVGWIAVVLGSVVAYAQYRRISRRGVEGVSFATWTLFIYVGVFWVIYGVAVRSWQLVLGCSLTLPLQLLIWYRLTPPAKLRSTFYSFLFILACCLLPAVAWGWAGAVVGVGVAGWITRGPQLVTLLRANGASGVSSSSWLTAALVSSLWIVYYVGARLWPVMIVTAVAGTVSLIIAALARWRHAQVHGSTNIVDLAPTLGAFED
jgi:uncharacterized protein with PQ loop repeat